MVARLKKFYGLEEMLKIKAKEEDWEEEEDWDEEEWDEEEWEEEEEEE